MDKKTPSEQFGDVEYAMDLGLPESHYLAKVGFDPDAIGYIEESKDKELLGVTVPTREGLRSYEPDDYSASFPLIREGLQKYVEQFADKDWPVFINRKLLREVKGHTKATEVHEFIHRGVNKYAGNNIPKGPKEDSHKTEELLVRYINRNKDRASFINYILQHFNMMPSEFADSELETMLSALSKMMDRKAKKGMYKRIEETMETERGLFAHD